MDRHVAVMRSADGEATASVISLLRDDERAGYTSTLWKINMFRFTGIFSKAWVVKLQF